MVAKVQRGEAHAAESRRRWTPEYCVASVAVVSDLVVVFPQRPQLVRLSDPLISCNNIGTHQLGQNVAQAHLKP